VLLSRFLPNENRNILDWDECVESWGGSRVRAEAQVVVLNVAGLTALVAFTGLVYLRTQEPLILLLGGLIAVASVLGAVMSKS